MRKFEWMNENLHDVDLVNSKFVGFVGNVRNAATRKIEYVKTNGRRGVCKPWWHEDIRDARKE